MVGCVQAVAGKKKILDQFRDDNNKEIISSSLVSLGSKEEVDMDEPLYNSPKK